jgi:hypothetical protein
MPIPFACESCGVKITAPDAAGGRKAPCPKCRTILIVPVPVAGDSGDIETRAAAILTEGDDAERMSPSFTPIPEPSSSPFSPARSTSPEDDTSPTGSPKWALRFFAGAGFLLACAVGITLYVLNDDKQPTTQPVAATPAAQPDSEKVNKQLADAKQAEQQLADEQVRLTKLKADLADKEKALADERERLDKEAKKDRLRDAAIRAKTERLLALSKRVDELIAADTANRIIIADYDKKTLSAFAEGGLTRDDRQRTPVELYWKGREKLIAMWQDKAEGMIADIDATLNVELSTNAPADVQEEFRAAAQKILMKGRNAIQASYYLPVNEVAEYARIAQKVNAERMAERKKKSNEAQDAGFVYCATLKGNDRNIALAAIERLKGIHATYVKGELSENSALKIVQYFQINTRPLSANSKVWDQAAILSKVVGDWMPDVDGKPAHDTTIAETWKAYQILLAKLELDGKLK